MSVTDVALLLAWVAILVMGLALGGVVGQLRALQAYLPRGINERLVAPALAFNGGSVKPPYVALFASPACDVCHSLLPAKIGDLQASAPPGFSLLLVSDAPYEPESEIARSGIQTVLDPEARNAFRVPGVPWVVAVDDEGQVVESRALTRNVAIEDLVNGIVKAEAR
ncbi:MAG: hypothetical protein R3258_06340 [Acidimicrobiia bacterium]|nr:hypothetical protein [Acidimicrobiia bacterium]